ncbi:alkylmercury lyase family protein [Jiangella alkaliphila]|uniref:Alkylmercury lyase n=1 Tax=Jiangella alkaliphila TaxID=419479 RepID=A0A1H2L6Z3_9ACTN|nr:alkylmercury lyase family protein [Jiangella alkaliphila]SDU76572.1 Alkylmercury lyase [Jiangella alkaliphila]
MSTEPAPRLDVLHVAECPNLAPLLERLREVTDLPVTVREITTDEEAASSGMAGSPTLLIDGTDPFGAPDDCGCGVACRLYRDDDGRLVPVPSTEQLRQALRAATPSGPADVVDALAAARARAVPLDPAQRAVHQAILRHFAAAGRPPTRADLDAVTADPARTAAALAELHDLDAVRLDPAGGIVVAYPFSATPTRHRVRIAGRTDVHAMCAIDALGIAPMLGQDTRIDSLDVTTGRAVAVTTAGGRTSWEPADAVVFVGADTCGGAAADCCCDYLNFFTSHAAAQAWTDAHPQIPGQILDQHEAQELAGRVFGPLLEVAP